MPDASIIDLEDLWTRSLADLQAHLTGAAQRAWLDDTRPVGFSDDTVYLAAPHNFAREQLDTRYGGVLRGALTRAAGRPLDVVVTVRPESAAQPDAGEPGATGQGTEAGDAQNADGVAGVSPAEAAREAQDRQTSARDLSRGEEAARTSAARADAARADAARADARADAAPERFNRADRGGELNDKYTFDRFVIGASNRFAHAAAFAVAEAPAKAYNPLFIYGGAGLGKTHLLQAIGHYTMSLYQGVQVRYVTSEQFTNEFIDAISNGRQVPFQRRYRDVDVLLIDDIQFLESKERTQEEFFHTFNALHNAEKQIVISSDRPPKQIGQLEERLRTRFEWGLITDIQPPDLETRLAILRKKAAQENLPVPDDVLELIASRISSNIREIEGALIRVTAFASLQRSDVTLQLAQMVLKDLFPGNETSEIGVSLIMAETANYFGLTIEDLCSNSRTRQLVAARQMAMYLTRELTELSLPKIGAAFGGRDHTTVIHANNKIGALMQERPAIYQQLQELTSRIKSAARQAR